MSLTKTLDSLLSFKTAAYVVTFSVICMLVSMYFVPFPTIKAGGFLGDVMVQPYNNFVGLSHEVQKELIVIALFTFLLALILFFIGKIRRKYFVKKN